MSIENGEALGLGLGFEESRELGAQGRRGVEVVEGADGAGEGGLGGQDVQALLAAAEKVVTLTMAGRARRSRWRAGNWVKAVTSWAAPVTTSSPSNGAAAWAPRPVTLMVK